MIEGDRLANEFINELEEGIGGLRFDKLVELKLEVMRIFDGEIARAHNRRPRQSPDQAWYWTERWQCMEREASADIAAGRVKRFDSAEDFVADLDREGRGGSVSLNPQSQ